MQTKTFISIAALLLACAAAPALAGGNDHAGHDHSHMDNSTSVGQPGDAKKVSRTITVDMSDAMRFTPDTISVKRGETIRFVVKNNGKIKHEFNLGSAAQLQAHAEMMQKMPGMQHAEPNSVSVEPGKTGEVIWQFTQAGTVDIACLYPGHFAAGMKGSIQVVAK